MSKLFKVSVLVSVVALLVSVLSVVVSLQAVQRVQTQRGSVLANQPAICDELANGFPQSAKKVSKNLGVPAARIEMYDYYACPGTYWSYIVWDGTTVTQTVPEGGQVTVYAPSSVAGDYFEGKVTGTRMFVSAVQTR